MSEFGEIQLRPFTQIIGCSQIILIQIKWLCGFMIHSVIKQIQRNSLMHSCVDFYYQKIRKKSQDDIHQYKTVRKTITCTHVLRFVCILTFKCHSDLSVALNGCVCVYNGWFRVLNAFDSRCVLCSRLRFAHWFVAVVVVIVCPHSTTLINIRLSSFKTTTKILIDLNNLMWKSWND